MKKVIITRSQLNEIMDSEKTQVTFNGNNATELGKNAQEKYNDAVRSGLKSNTIQMVGKTNSNNATDKEETVVSFDTTKPDIQQSVTSAFQTAVNNGADPNKISIQGNTEDVLNGVSEGKKYTKLQVEKARLHEMRKNGRMLTKKQLTEELLSDGHDLKSRLKNMNSFEVFECFRQTFGDEALQEISSTWDMLDAIIAKVNSSVETKKREFLDRLDGADYPSDDAIDLSNPM